MILIMDIKIEEINKLLEAVTREQLGKLSHEDLIDLFLCEQKNES